MKFLGLKVLWHLNLINNGVYSAENLKFHMYYK